MVEQFLNHIHDNALCKTTDKILLAVSGGLDSMVMFHLMRQSGFTIGVAHCNFQLRGADSDADEEQVRAVCQHANVPFFVKRFDTADYAAAQGISVQMAARDLRYQWFEELIQAQHYDYVATAHHFDDVTESVLMNLVRGTGIDGFRGIAVKKESVVRPLLFASRQMIEAYAGRENIVWREDASNASDDYQRNYLRHQIIPRLLEVNPSFESGFRDTRERLLGARALMQAYIDRFRGTAVDVRPDNTTTLDIGKVRASEAPAVLLWELIKGYGFRYDQCRKVVEDHQPGKIFQSATHQLVVDRVHYILEPRQVLDFRTCILEEGQLSVGEPPFVLTAREVGHEDFQLVKDPTRAQLDADRLKFPLLWRKWQAGDYFMPLGMQHDKKLSDFLIDLKIPFNSKADITVLESANDIVWVVGFRINERYKVTSDTKRILIVEQAEKANRTG